jgi:hypothetical protein
MSESGLPRNKVACNARATRLVPAQFTTTLQYVAFVIALHTHDDRYVLLHPAVKNSTSHAQPAKLFSLRPYAQNICIAEPTYGSVVRTQIFYPKHLDSFI